MAIVTMGRYFCPFLRFLSFCALRITCQRKADVAQYDAVQNYVGDGGIADHRCSTGNWWAMTVVLLPVRSSMIPSRSERVMPSMASMPPLSITDTSVLVSCSSHLSRAPLRCRRQSISCRCGMRRSISE